MAEAVSCYLHDVECVDAIVALTSRSVPRLHVLVNVCTVNESRTATVLISVIGQFLFAFIQIIRYNLILKKKESK